MSGSRSKKSGGEYDGTAKVGKPGKPVSKQERFKGPECAAKGMEYNSKTGKCE